MTFILLVASAVLLGIATVRLFEAERVNFFAAGVLCFVLSQLL